MKLPPDTFDESLLSAYLDGELDAEECAELERVLRERPRLQQQLDGLRELQSQLRSLKQPPAPPDLRERILQRIGKTHAVNAPPIVARTLSLGKKRWVAAVLSLAALLTLTLFLAVPLDQPPLADVARSTADATSEKGRIANERSYEIEPHRSDSGTPGSAASNEMREAVPAQQAPADAALTQEFAAKEFALEGAAADSLRADDATSHLDYRAPRLTELPQQAGESPAREEEAVDRFGADRLASGDTRQRVEPSQQSAAVDALEPPAESWLVSVPTDRQSPQLKQLVLTNAATRVYAVKSSVEQSPQQIIAALHNLPQVVPAVKGRIDESDAQAVAPRSAARPVEEGVYLVDATPEAIQRLFADPVLGSKWSLHDGALRGKSPSAAPRAATPSSDPAAVPNDPAAPARPQPPAVPPAVRLPSSLPLAPRSGGGQSPTADLDSANSYYSEVRGVERSDLPAGTGGGLGTSRKRNEQAGKSTSQEDRVRVLLLLQPLEASTP